VIGIEQITAYTTMSEPLVRKMLEQGMPGFCEDRRWYSSKSAIDKYFFMRSITSGKNRTKSKKY
jgi:hypothetical protein